MEFILTVAGIIIGLVFGFYSVYTYRKSKKTVSMAFQNKECYSLFREDVNRLNIDINYNSKPLSNSLILIKARLLNNGGVDIDNTRIHNPLKLKTSEGFIWLESTSTISPKGSNINIKILSQSDLQIEWDLLKKNEFIELEALVKVEQNNTSNNKASNFYKGLSFEFRITDLNEIQKESINKIEEKKRKFLNRAYIIFGLTAFIAGAFITINSFFPKNSIIPQNYNIEYTLSHNDQILKGQLKSTDDDNVEIIQIDSKEVIELSLNDFNQNYRIESIERTYISKEESWFTRIFGIIYTIMGATLLFLKINVKRKN